MENSFEEYVIFHVTAKDGSQKPIWKWTEKIYKF